MMKAYAVVIMVNAESMKEVRNAALRSVTEHFSDDERMDGGAAFLFRITEAASRLPIPGIDGKVVVEPQGVEFIEGNIY